MLTVCMRFILNLTCIIFFTGLLGVVLNRKNILITIMSIKLLLAINLNFVAFSIYLDDIVQIFVLFILTIAAAESAIGLAIVKVLYRLKISIFQKRRDLNSQSSTQQVDALTKLSHISQKL